MTQHEPPRLSGTNLRRVADHNQRVTLHAIRRGGPLTRVDLARTTGLTGAAIANKTRRLLDDGMIEEAGQRRGARGQPATKLVVRPEACYSVGINIDRDHMTLVLVNFSAQILARKSVEIDFALPADVRQLYRRSIRSMLNSARVDPSKLVGIGVACPDDLGRVRVHGRPPAYSEWEGVDIGTLFEEPLQLPVFIENDAAAAAMGEMQLGLGQSYNSFFYVLVSSLLGGGFVADGAYVRGARGRSGEVGFLTVANKHGVREPVQTVVSLSGLAKHLAASGFGLDQALRQSRWDPEVETCLGDWIEEAVEALRGPLEAINCLIDPAVILVGGRLPSRLVEWLADRLNAAVSPPSDAPAAARVLRAALSEDAPAVGAAILPFSHFVLPKPGALWKDAVKLTTEATD